MIFPVAECERTVQVGDKTRLSGVKSFVGKGEEPMAKVEICPDYTGITSQPFTIQLDGTFDDQSTYITDINGDMSQVRPGMTIKTDIYFQDVEASVIFVDLPSRTITADQDAMRPEPAPFTVEGQIPVNDPIFIDVTGQREADWYLDWVYQGETRSVVMAVRVTSGTSTEIALKSIQVLAAADDVLFSSDDDLTALEPGLVRYTPDGRASFINVHREARQKILEALSDRGIRTPDKKPLTTAILSDVTEVRTWSRDLTLALIFQGMSNESGDLFQAKAKFYQDLAEQRADRAYLSLSQPFNESDEPVRSGQVHTVSLIR